MEVRLLIAFVLMGLVIVWQYSMRPAPTPVPAASVSATAKDTTGQDPAKNTAIPIPPQTPVSAPASAEVPGAVQAAAEEIFTVETDVFRVQFSNRGAVVKSWTLKAYKDHAGQALELVNLKALDKVPAPFAINFRNQAPAVDLNTALFQVSRADEGREVSFRYSDGRTVATKTFNFTPATYLLEVTSEVVANGIRIPHELAWRGGFGDATVAKPAADQHSLYYDLSNSKLKQVALKDAKDNPVTNTGKFSFAGLEDHYFAGVFLPADPTSVELTTFSDSVPDLAGAVEPRIGSAVGGESLNKFSFFAGPKDSNLLGKIDPKLEQLIDWGTWFGFIAKPLFFVLQWVAVRMTHNYGWAIVVVTIGINMVLFPLRLTSMKSSKKMQLLQPQIKEINDKYKALPMRDPKKADQQQELMDLYKKNGVNPVGGCLPMALQLPILVAFYTVLGVTIELRGANWLWVHDLSQAETLPIHILPLLVVVTQFISQKMTPSPGMDPAQAKMMLFMPLMFGYMFYFYSAGLALYWFTGGLVSIVQQLVLNRAMPAPAVTAPKPQKKKK